LALIRTKRADGTTV